MKKILVFIVALTIVVGVASGCGKKDADSLVANSSVKTEGMSFAIYTSKPDTLCPILSENDTNLNMLDIVYDGLIRLNDKLSPEPCLAESWSVSADGKRWTFNLRPNVLWHDGSPFTANDVVYTVKEIKNNESGAYRYHTSYISDIRAKGNSVVEIDLTEGWPGFVNLLYFPIIKNSGAINPATFKPIGTGSYKFEDRNEVNTFYLVRNDHWWGGKALTETITVRVLPDDETALQSFGSGVIDITVAEEDNWSMYANSATSDYTALSSSEFTFLGINNKGALQFTEVRKAVSMAINRQKIIDDGFMEYAVAATVPFNPKWDICSGRNFNTQQNAENAKKLLKDNKWVQQNGYYTKTLEKPVTVDVASESGESETVEVSAYSTDFTIIYNEENELRGLIAEEIKNNLREMGMRVVLAKLPYDEYQSRISEGDYDMFVGSIILSPDLKNSFFVGSGNVFGFSNDNMSKAINEARKKNPEDMKAAFDGVITQFEELCPVVGICFSDKILIHSKTLKGSMNSSCFDVYRGIETIQKGVAQ